jgi:protein-tyrosine phosphatase
MNLDPILDNLLLGSHPATRADLETLRDIFEVTGVLNVQTDEDFRFWDIDWAELAELYREMGIVVRRVPMYDFHHDDLVRNLPSCVDALEEMIGAGQRVLVHCTAGMNRSPSVVIAYLHWVLDYDLRDAYDRVLQCRRCDPDVAAIREASQLR